MRRIAAAALLVVSLLMSNLAYPAPARADDDGDGRVSGPKTATPIKHLVVIFDENNSFDHYFGTYPVAMNPPGEPEFHGAPNTPAVNGLTPTLLSNNPNKLNGTGSNPFRLDRSEAATCDNDNHYTDEQRAFDAGLMDQFSITSVAPVACGSGFFFGSPAQLLGMAYYDGNTVTALWNYAQHFAMSDNFFDTEFGTTVMGHMNLLSGQTFVGTSANVAGKIVNGSIIANVDPSFANDDCAGSAPNVTMPGKNVGDLLTAAKVSWGWFYADFAPVSISAGGVATCQSIYNPHYAPFNYYTSTSNPHHKPPTSVAAIGTNADQANHNYAYSDFLNALAAGNLPSVTFLKASVTDTGHPMDSTPLAEQNFLVSTINALQQSRFWKDTAIIIAYDDSDGWYDHAAAPIIHTSNDPANDGVQGNPKAATGSCGPAIAGTQQDRCGFGVRLPFLVISPYAKRNYVDHSLNDTTSILRFVEYNWNLGTIGDPQSFDVLASGTILGMFDFDNYRGDDRDADGRKLILDPTYGTVVGSYDRY